MTGQWMAEVPGLGRKRLHRLRNAYRDRFGTAEGLSGFLYGERDGSLAMFLGGVLGGLLVMHLMRPDIVGYRCPCLRVVVTLAAQMI